MSAAKGMWYQRESKLKIPLSSASLVVRPQWAKTSAMTPTVTAQTSVPGPVGPVTAGDPPAPAVAEASSGLVPPTAPPTGRSVADRTAIKSEEPTKVHA